MNSAEFVGHIRKSVIEENASIYRSLFSATSLQEASNPYWQKALKLYSGLSSEQKEIFFQVIRQVMMDTTANILGVVDGINTMEGIEEEFELYAGGKKISGGLQDVFLQE